MNVTINTRLLIRTLSFSLLFLLVLHLLFVFMIFSRKFEGLVFYDVFYRFYFEHKNNLPSFFNTFLLLLASALLYYIYRAHSGKFYRETKWLVGSILFLLMAIEENASIHVFLSALKPEYSLVTVLVLVSLLGLFLIVLSVYFGRFMMRLPRRIAVGFTVSAAIYAAGAVILDQTSSAMASVTGKRNLTFVGISTLEETMEMTAIIVFIHFLLEYIKTELNPVEITLK